MSARRRWIGVLAILALGGSGWAYTIVRADGGRFEAEGPVSYGNGKAYFMLKSGSRGFMAEDLVDKDATEKANAGWAATLPGGSFKEIPTYKTTIAPRPDAPPLGSIAPGGGGKTTYTQQDIPAPPLNPSVPVRDGTHATGPDLSDLVRSLGAGADAATPGLKEIPDIDAFERDRRDALRQQQQDLQAYAAQLAQVNPMLADLLSRTPMQAPGAGAGPEINRLRRQVDELQKENDALRRILIEHGIVPSKKTATASAQVKPSE